MQEEGRKKKTEGRKKGAMEKRPSEKKGRSQKKKEGQKKGAKKKAPFFFEKKRANRKKLNPFNF